MEEQSISSTLKYNKVETNSRILKRSFGNKKWGMSFILLTTSLVCYCLLFVFLTLLVNLYVGKSGSNLERSWKQIVKLAKTELSYQFALSDASDQFFLLLDKTNHRHNWTTGHYKYQSQSEIGELVINKQEHFDTSRVDAYEILEEGYTSLKQWETEVMNSAQPENSDVIDIIFRQRLEFECSQRFSLVSEAGIAQLTNCDQSKSKEPMIIYLQSFYSDLVSIVSNLNILFSSNDVPSGQEGELVKFRVHLLTYKILEKGIYDMRSKLERVFEIEFRSVQAEYQNVFLLTTLPVMIVAFLCFLMMIYYIVETKKRMVAILESYSLLKPVEVELQDLALADMIEVCTNFKFHEKHLIDNFFAFDSKWNSLKDALTAGFERIHTSRSKKVNNIKKTEEIPTIRKIHYLNIFIIAIFFFLMIVAFYLDSVSSVTLNLITISVETLVSVININTNYIAANIHMGFGRTHNLEGKSLETQIYKNEIPNLISKWTTEYQKSIKANFGRSGFEDFESLLLNDFCQYLYTERKLSICTESLSKIATKGFVQYLKSEQKILSESYESMKMSESEYLEATSQSVLNLSLTHVPQVYFKQPFVELRFLHNTMMHTFTDRLTRLLEERIDQIESKVGRFLAVIKLYIMVCLLVILVGLAYWTLKRLVEDFKYCYETFRVISPDIILNNPYLFNSFKMYFQLSIS